MSFFSFSFVWRKQKERTRKTTTNATWAVVDTLLFSNMEGRERRLPSRSSLVEVASLIGLHSITLNYELSFSSKQYSLYWLCHKLVCVTNSSFVYTNHTRQIKPVLLLRLLAVKFITTDYNFHWSEPLPHGDKTIRYVCELEPEKNTTRCSKHGRSLIHASIGKNSMTKK